MAVMATRKVMRWGEGLWSLVAEQHGAVTRRQLLGAGYSAAAIKHRIASGRLHPRWPGVYAVGRPELTQQGEWMAAVLCYGERAVLSHTSAAALWGLLPAHGLIDVSLRDGRWRSRPGITLHRRPTLAAVDATACGGIPVTTPACTLIDIAVSLTRGKLERAINEADRLDLVDPESLRIALDRSPRRPGVGILRRVLDRRTFVLTDSELERRFLSLIRRARLPLPQTGRRLNGFKVDFYWPDAGLVVETDGLRYHRTPAQQARDHLRDQVHVRAGLTCLRFTDAQVRFESRHVQKTLGTVLRRSGG